jgi:hypothetical protein
MSGYIGKQVPVYVDPLDKSKYYVDVQHVTENCEV